MKNLKTLSVAVAFILLVCVYTFAEDAETKTTSQQICPVMFVGDMGCTAIKHDIYTNYNNKRIYFCSKGCMEKFKKDPETYLKRAEKKGIQFEKAPVDRN